MFLWEDKDSGIWGFGIELRSDGIILCEILLAVQSQYIWSQFVFLQVIINVTFVYFTKKKKM